MKPRIAIPVPTFSDLAYNHLNWPAYADAVLASGGEPVRLELGLSRREAKELAGKCNGFLLPGSPADVAPERYGQERQSACAPADFVRESLDEVLLEEAELCGTPLLAICFGMQLLNVRRGGTLVQDLNVMPVNHSAGRCVAAAHSVTVAGGTQLSAMLDRRESHDVHNQMRLPVNSSHHQAVAIPGAGLRVSARSAEDGVIEAVEGCAPDTGFLIGVQWHPERTFHESATSRNLFAEFIGAAASGESVAKS